MLFRSGAGNYSKPKSFQRQEPQPDQQVRQDDIPVIEENYTPPAQDSGAQDADTGANMASDEIDVKDIPF